MDLIQKKVTIQLSSRQRVHKLIYISYSAVLIIKRHNIAIYDITTGKQGWNYDVNNWKTQCLTIQKTDLKQTQNTQTGQQSESKTSAQQTKHIIQAAYHPILRKLYILLGLSQKQKHCNWQLVTVNISNKSSLQKQTPKLLTSFEKQPTKYGQMQLQPRIIIFPKSDYLVLLRQFYNDTLIVIYKDERKVSQLFVNQQNMMELDQKERLVSFRAIFNSTIIWEQFDIRDSPKAQSKDQKWRRKQVEHEIHRSGVIVAIKHIKLPTHLQPYISPYNLQYQQKPQITQPKFTILAINWRNKTTSYLIHNSIKNQILKDISLDQIPNRIILSYFTINSELNKICSLQRIGNQVMFTCQEFFKTNSSNNISFNSIKVRVQEEMEQWDSFVLDGNQFVVVNYTQSIDNEDEVICRFYRNINKKQAIIHLSKKLNIQECILQMVSKLSLQNNLQIIPN